MFYFLLMTVQMGKLKRSHDDDVLCHCTDHGEGVSLTDCWGDTTTGHLMCECPVHRPGSHNRSGVPDTWSRSRSQRLSRSRDRAEEEKRETGGRATLSHNNHMALR